jgi:hypothetical protein
MKAKLMMLIFSVLLLSGCQSAGQGCGGCVTGYWATSCNTPNSGGASESQFTTVGNPNEVVGDYSYSGYDGNSGGCSSSSGGCGSYETSSCSTGGCGYFSAGPNW